MKRVIAIFGMPRSGTSFVGQILDSHPKTAFRMEPLFAYKLKNIVDENSERSQYVDFFQKAFDSNEDHFMNQIDNRQKGSYPTFVKIKPDILVFKTTRFHHILPIMMKYFDKTELMVVSIVRNPCGAIYSWINHPNEFPKEADWREEWRSGACRKTAKEEYWGFEDWKNVTSLHLDLERQYNNFRIFQYERIVNNLEPETDALFDFVGLQKEQQVIEFLKKCNERHDEDPYSVFKDKRVVNQWERGLDPNVQKEIISECNGTPLARFIN